MRKHRNSTVNWKGTVHEISINFDGGLSGVKRECMAWQTPVNLLSSFENRGLSPLLVADYRTLLPLKPMT